MDLPCKELLRLRDPTKCPQNVPESEANLKADLLTTKEAADLLSASALFSFSYPNHNSQQEFATEIVLTENELGVEESQALSTDDNMIYASSASKPLSLSFLDGFIKDSKKIYVHLEPSRSSQCDYKNVTEVKLKVIESNLKDAKNFNFKTCIEIHDLSIKMQQVKNSLARNHPVKVSVSFSTKGSLLQTVLQVLRSLEESATLVKKKQEENVLVFRVHIS